MARLTALACLASAFRPAEAFTLTTPPRTWISRASATPLSMSTAVAEPEVAEINPRSVGLALALDDGTRKSHSVAENTAFVTG